ncbi:hypothetical protein DTO271D3_3256 [Paecilomyces variotii]|nr:hypothetical protein DTO032I3_6841 [Paecilomyces variotii]KAJ9278084.1 hypothetical protein DTO021D3_5051 [Paecilomyces variotii]KAJ9316451.1 hypothetical protein DTO271D3_3256 [Paecilomyces variotii]KAJ9326542.1 hypothetical protein DTO027B3_2533 [Paecilomyces variotii]KAJ9338074.1 hypothetical protein DTO027B5_226 [Paecilomyces variotii]
MTIEPLEFDVDGLYILVRDLGDTYRFHWGLYLATKPCTGDLFHAVNTVNKNSWAYEVRQDINLIDWRFLAAVKVGMIETELHDALRSRLQEIPMGYSSRYKEEMSCRVWVKESLFALDNEGFIQLANDYQERRELRMNPEISKALLLADKDLKKVETSIIDDEQSAR